jgi:hypothetical protein
MIHFIGAHLQNPKIIDTKSEIEYMFYLSDGQDPIDTKLINLG